MKLSYSIALRFLRSNLTQTIFIILGIGIGVSVQVFIGSLINGLQKSLVESTIGNSSHITISSSDDMNAIINYEDLIATIKKSDNRITYISPVLESAAFLSKNTESQSLLIRGFDFNKAEDIYKLSDYIIEGSLPKEVNEIMLGVSVSEKYNIKLGNEVTIVMPSKETFVCKVVGLFDFKVSQINENWCITSINNLQTLLSSNDIVSSIEIQLNSKDVFLADVTADNILSVIDNKMYNVVNWKEQNEQLLSGLQGQSISSIMIQIFVLVSVVLGIASVLAISVMQKSKQIGILKAMGIKDSKSSFIFLFQGLILGILGAITGILLGLGLSFAFTTFALNPDGTPVVSLYIDKTFIIISGLIAVASCVAASLIPARASSKLNPIDIIRNN